MRRTRPAADAAVPDAGPLLAPLARARGLVLAVSGGADSTALMALVAAWEARPPALVVCVDHGLRPESAAEAALVAANAGHVGLPWRVMQAPQRQAGNLQDWARRVRYCCLATAARDAGFDTIVTAHHRDDQAETFLLRLARGSGVYGLAAMAAESSAGLRVARPLLGLTRDQLARIAVASGLRTISDPGNEDPRFARIRMRRLLPLLDQHGLGTARLAETAARLRRAASAIDHYAGRLVLDHFAPDASGVFRGPAGALADVPEEVALRTLALMVRAAAGQEYTPRMASVEALLQAVRAAGAAGRVGRTLHGAAIDVQGGCLTVRREWGRGGLAAVPASAGSSLVWDGRFRVHLPALPGPLSVGPLGQARRRLRSVVADRAALRALPGLYSDGTLLAVPEMVAAVDRGDGLARLATECIVGRGFGGA